MNTKPTLHLLGIPHTVTRPEFSHCAFTSKVRLFPSMMRLKGYEVIHYGNGGALTKANEHVDILSEDVYNAFMGGPPPVHEPSFDLSKFADANLPIYHAFNKALAVELQKRVDPERDLVCCTFGTGHKEALDKLPNLLTVETGIGYPISYLPYRIFESYAWMHNTLGRAGLQDGNDYHWVVPNYYDINEWNICPETWKKEYVLFIGRISDFKGMRIFREVAKFRSDLHFLCVGQGDPSAYLSDDIPNLEYLPPVSGLARAELYSRALATVCMTRFLEPFCQVHIESQLCGTPVITSNFGVFGETVVDGENGFKCNTLGDILAALERVGDLSRQNIQSNAQQKYNLRTVGDQYDSVFRQICDLRGEGWYTLQSRHGPITKVQLPLDRIDPWGEAQKWEKAWWTEDKYEGEKQKQALYAPFMGIYDLNFNTKSILDLGCGPVSMLQRATFKKATAVDPLDYDDVKIYSSFGIKRVVMSAEDFTADEPHDEVWIYNVLQHVRDPQQVIESAKRNCIKGGTIRMFEWVDMPPHVGHPHELKERLFELNFGEGWHKQLWSTGTMKDCVFEGNYIALAVTKMY